MQVWALPLTNFVSLSFLIWEMGMITPARGVREGIKLADVGKFPST